MRTLYIAALIGTVALHAQVPAPTSVEKLLDGLPPQRVLHEAKNIVRGANVQGQTKNTPALTNANESIAKAQAIIPQLRSQIKVGTSVFDYPSLLAHGDITWDASSKEYELYMGVFLKPEGSDPFDFKIVFDTTGTIRAIKNVVWKH